MWCLRVHIRHRFATLSHVNENFVHSCEIPSLQLRVHHCSGIPYTIHTSLFLLEVMLRQLVPFTRLLADCWREEEVSR
jgi:hypothetical protein